MSATTEVTARPGSLAARFDPRANALPSLRLVLAAVVAVAHATALGFGWQPSIGDVSLADLAVDGFFVLSGFLVTRSYLRLDAPARYAWHRFLRIMPGFWVCLVVTGFGVAPLLAVLAGRSAATVLGGPESAWDYLLNNALLLIRQYGVTGLPVDGHSPGVLDGSLWTLFYEALCYAGILVLGVLGLLRRGPLPLTVAALLGWALSVAAAAGLPLGSQYALPLASVFLFGAAGYLLADRLPMDGRLAVLAGGLVVAGLLTGPVPHALITPALAYLFLWAVVAVPARRPLRRDLSYGLYVYHWPVAQVLIALGAAALGAVVLVAFTLALSVLVAAVSWRYVEEPALRWKDLRIRRFQSRAA